MNGLDIVLINVISYLGGILSGIYIHHKMNKSKSKNKYKEDNDYRKKEKEFDVVEKYQSPILAATAYPTAPPPMNPNISQNTMQKIITITAE